MAFEYPQDRGTTAFSYPLIIFVLAIVLLVSLMSGVAELAMLATLVLLLMVISKSWSLVSLAHVSCSIKVDKSRAFPQEMVTLTTDIENKKFLPIWVQIRWPVNNALGTDDETSAAPQESGVLGYQHVRFNRHLKTLRRGVYQVGPSHICSGDFFGFFRSPKSLDEAQEIVIYPRLVELKQVQLPRHDLFGTPGEQSPVKDPVYIMGTDDYHPSRPSRHIHWKASATHSRLKEKIFEPSKQGKIMVVLDTAAFERNDAAEPFEDTLEIIASLMVQWTTKRLSAGFMTNGFVDGGELAAVPGSSNPKQLSTILEVLARLQMKKKRELADVMQLNLGQRRNVHCAYFCYQCGPDSDGMRRICGSRSIPLTIFTWHLNPKSSAEEYREAINPHLLKNIPVQEELH